MAAQPQSGQSGHESSQVPLEPILWCLEGFIVTAVVIHLALIGYASLLGASHKSFGRVHQIQPNQAYPAPALQVNPQIDLQNYRTLAEHDLKTYGWIDQAHGVTKIPVDRAMDLLLARGLPLRPAVQDGPT